ncbi:MAG TPA: DUF4157 domain-containing protein [Rhizomicrobium sp.]|jgi:hypothetical protein
MTQKVVTALNTNAAANGGLQSGRIQRQCSCGAHTPGGGTCESCETDKGRLQRRANGTAVAAGIPPEVGAVLRSPGSPLDADTRDFMERGFARDFSALRVSPAARPEIGPANDEFESQARAQADAVMAHASRARSFAPLRHNFSQVRVHTGGLAADAAKSVGADAFTLGRDVVFGAGHYAPHTQGGRQLIAHELTHVVQQGAGGGAIQRVSAGESVRRFFRDIGILIASAFGYEHDFDDSELKEYLDEATAKGGPVKGPLSDQKARGVVKRWQAGVAEFDLNAIQKRILIQDLDDGVVVDGDRHGMITILRNSTDSELTSAILPGIDFKQVLDDFDSGKFTDRIASWFLDHPAINTGKIADIFTEWFLPKTALHADDELLSEPFAKQYAAANFGGDAKAAKIVVDILDVKSKLSYADAAEFRADVKKRLSVSNGMVESQSKQKIGVSNKYKLAFGYPSELDPGCDGYVAPAPGQEENQKNARVNKAARDKNYWEGPLFKGQDYYYFVLTAEGKKHGFDALQTLFTQQASVCDRTLIHCDYLVNVVEFRAYAEAMGQEKFDAAVLSGKVDMTLNWSGFAPGYKDWKKSPKSLGYTQRVVLTSKNDLIIGDHVIFFNHLAFAPMNTVGNDWQLENAILTDKDDDGNDLFLGHGSKRGDGRGQTEHKMLVELGWAFNALIKEPLELSEKVRIDGDASAEAKLLKGWPNVHKKGNDFIVRDAKRGNREYPLQPADTNAPEDDEYLPGLLDPMDRSKLYPIDRPIESEPGKAPKP